MTALLRIVCLIAVASVVVPRVAIADDEIAKPTTAEAREHLAKGTKLYRLREFDKAIDEYKAGALVEDAAVFYYNLGQCYRQLGRPEDAIWHYQRFLDRANPLPPKYKKAVEDFIREMKAEIDKRTIAKPIEPAPTPPISERADHKPRTITIVDPAEPWYTDGFGWGLTGTGTVAAGVSIWLLADAKSLDDQANMSSSQQTQNELRERAGQRRLAGAIVGVAGGLVLVTGVVKLVVSPGPRSRTVNASSLDVVLTPSGLAVAGRF